MTWLFRSIDHNLSASAARRACSGGIIADPGSLVAPARSSTPRRTRSGTNKNSPPQLVVNCVPGVSVNVRASATGSTEGTGPAADRVQVAQVFGSDPIGSVTFDLAVPSQSGN